MFRISRLTDYGILTLTYLARDPDLAKHNARDVAEQLHLPLPTVSKILKVLARSGLLVAHRGVRGGFGLARPAKAITIAEIITALEGPIALTVCGDDTTHDCAIEQHCPCRDNWQKINHAVRGALDKITLADMAHPLPHEMTGARVETLSTWNV